MKMTRSITPKLEEMIPIYGYKKYLDRVSMEKKLCHDSHEQQIIDYPHDYTVRLLFYNMAAVGASIVGLTELIDYVAR